MRSVSSKGLSLVPNSESTLQPLADVLQASPESDALVILGRLLDSLPIAKATSPDHLYFSQVRARCGTSRAAFSVGRKILRRSYHVLRGLGDEALAPAS